MKLNTDIVVESTLRYSTEITAVAGGLDVHYPFADELKMEVDDIDMPLDTRVNLCIYQINSAAGSTPFLEFLLYLEGSELEKGGQRLTFPYILSRHTKSGLVEQCTPALSALFGGLDQTKYTGFFYEKAKKRCTLFFNHFYAVHVTGVPMMQKHNDLQMRS